MEHYRTNASAKQDDEMKIDFDNDRGKLFNVDKQSIEGFSDAQFQSEHRSKSNFASNVYNY